MYFIKRTLSPAGKFEDFSLSKSKLRIILIKVRLRKFEKPELFLKMLRKV